MSDLLDVHGPGTVLLKITGHAPQEIATVGHGGLHNARHMGGPDRGVTLALFIIYYVFVWPSSGRIGKEQRSPVRRRQAIGVV